MRKMTNKQYSQYVEDRSPKSKVFRNSFRAFVVGGGICMIGQGISDLVKKNGADKLESAALTSIILIFVGILLTGLNVYDEIGRFAGAGSIVPITGFANSVVSPAMEYKSEGYIMGVGARMFVIAGPVLVYGITSSVVVGVIYFFFKDVIK